MIAYLRKSMTREELIEAIVAYVNEHSIKEMMESPAFRHGECQKERNDSINMIEV